MSKHAIHITGASNAESAHNLARHEAQLAKLPCPRLDGREPVDMLTKKVIEGLDG